MPESIRVMIVEDTQEIREGLADLVRGAENFQLMGAHESAEDALRQFLPDQADVALVDIKLPGASGIELIVKLKTLDPELQCIMLTVFDDDRRIFESIKAGASGYLLKTTPSEKILESIREVNYGGAPMSGRIARRVLEYFQPSSNDSIESAGLTRREQEILKLLAQGLLYQEIATELSLALSTVKSHCHHIYEKLHVKNRTQAIRKLSSSTS